MNKKETDKKTKLLQEKCNTILGQLLRDEDNKYCCDCDSKGPRWASWNLGIFLCIRCAGIHRNLGVHISKVKSVNLDTWAPEQVVSLQQMGNSRARAVYEALLADNFRRPQTDSGLESFIRAKYEHKKYIAREWVPPPPITKVDWDREIEEELEAQKRKKKAVTTATVAAIPEPAKLAPSPVNVTIPAPPHSPKSSLRAEAKKSAAATVSLSSNSMDLLGLGTSTTPAAASPVPSKPIVAGIGDGFELFASVSPAKAQQSTEALKPTTDDALAQEENDFFNQKTVNNGEKGKLTKDSILALYGNAPAAPQPQQFTPGFQQFPGQDQFFAYGQPQNAPTQFTPAPQQPAFGAVPQPFGVNQPPMMYNNNGNFGAFNANLGTMQTQQINKLNELNIKKIESLNFNNFK